MGGKHGVFEELHKVPGSQKKLSKEEWGRRWEQREGQRPENVGLVKTRHQNLLSYSS